MKLHKIDTKSRIYYFTSGSGGISGYGFDILDRKARAVAEWALLAPPDGHIGTEEHFRQCAEIMASGEAYAKLTGQRCDADLTPELIGLEGKCVLVRMPEGHSYRFFVGKSTGWLPVHLELSTKNSRSGQPCYLPAGATVRVMS